MKKFQLYVIPVLIIIRQFLWNAIYWSPALYKRPFLTKQSKQAYVQFQLNAFVFPQLNKIFVAFAALNLAILILSLTIDDSYNSPIAPALFMVLHGGFFLVKYCGPRGLFRNSHMLFSLLSAFSVYEVGFMVNTCMGGRASNSLIVTCLGFYMLIVTIYFQYSTLLTVFLNSLAFMDNIYNYTSDENTIREVNYFGMTWGF